MAVIYYPQGSKIVERNTASGSQVIEVLNVLPNSIFWFDVSGSISQSILVETASYAFTASFALNASSVNQISVSWASSSLTSISSSWASQSLSSSYITSSGIIGNITAFSSSWASQSFSSSYALTASFVSGSGGTTLITGQTYTITSSWAETSSYVLNSVGAVDILQVQIFS
jgi:hypothetical protein